MKQRELTAVILTFSEVLLNDLNRNIFDGIRTNTSLIRAGSEKFERKCTNSKCVQTPEKLMMTT